MNRLKLWGSSVCCGGSSIFGGFPLKGMAEPVFSAEDLLFHLGINPECSKKSKLRGRGSSELKLTGNQKILFDLIELGEKNFDEICELTQLPVEVLNLHLTELEFSGLIKQLPGRIYTLS